MQNEGNGSAFGEIQVSVQVKVQMLWSSIVIAPWVLI